MALYRNSTGASSDFSSFNFAPPRVQVDDLSVPWEGQSLGFSGQSTLPPLGARSSVPSTPERTSRNSRPVNNLQSFNFSTPRRSIPSSQFPPARPSSSVPFSQSAPSGVGFGEHNPLARFYHDEEQPWNPFANDSAPSAKRGAASQVARPNLHLHTYRSPPQSELESTDTGFYQSDSGYHTHSVRSAEPADCSQDLPAQFTDNFANTFSAFTITMPSLPTPNSDHPEAQHLSRTPSSRSKGPLEVCRICGETPKCPSDFKKHMLKHEKPHRCEVPACTRTQGFTTVNDLIRHQKSVHKMHSIGKTKSYKCASATCRNPEKEWPRLDNFKQHIVRMHPDEDKELLIERSEIREPAAAALSIENTLAGMNPTASYQGEESFVSPASLAARNDPSPLIQGWNSIQSQSRMEVDLDQSSTRRTSGTSATQPSETRSSSVHSLLSAPAPIPVQPGSSGPTGGNTPSSRNLSALAELAVADASRRNSGSTHRSPATPAFPPAAQPMIEQIVKQGEKTDGLSSIATFLANQIRVNGSDNLGTEIQKALRELKQQFDSDQKPSSSKRDALPMRNTAVRRSPQAQMQNDSSSSDEGSVSLEELKRGLQTLASVIKKPRCKTDAKGIQKKVCPKCRKVLERTCDMNKHMKRHTRPYGCTFSKCSKEFGSKNDWKRHENSLHFQIELFRCQIADTSAAARYGHCAQIHYSRGEFESHLVEKHHCSQELLADRIKEAHIGRNNQVRFWCGFCRKIVALNEQGVQGWDERYNHIDAHFKRGERIDNWVDAEANKTKGEMLRESRNKKGESGDDDGGAGAGGDDDDDMVKASPSSMSASTHASSAFSGKIPEIIVQASSAHEPSKKKRKLDADVNQSAKPPKGREWVIFCCQCTQGPHSEKLYVNCLNCEHNFSICSNCTRKVIRTGSLDLDVSSYVP